MILNLSPDASSAPRGAPRPVDLPFLERPAMTNKSRSILLFSPDAEVTHAIGNALAGIEGMKLRAEAAPLTAMNGKAAAMAAGKDVVIFETSENESADIAAITALKTARAAGGMLLALADSGITLSRVRALAQAGVDEVIPRHDAGKEVGARILDHYRSLDLAAISDAPEHKGRIIAVAKARGGVGATTVAANLAHDLVGQDRLFHRARKKAVALVDLDLQFGSVGTLFDLEESDALMELALHGAPPDAAFLSSALVKLPSGLSILPAPAKFMPLDSLQPAQIGALLDLMQRRHDFVIVDLPHALGVWLEPVMRRADELIIVSDTAVPSVRHCRRLIEFFTADNPNLPVRVVINHEKRALLGSGVQKDVQKALNRKLDTWLPHDPKAARTSADRGKPLASVAPGSQLGKAIARLARQTIADHAPPQTSAHVPTANRAK